MNLHHQDKYSKQKLEKFKNWLQNQGCEILPVTNEYELLRFREKETGVLYKTGKTNSGFTYHAIQCFLQNKKWYGAPVSTGRSKNYARQKKQLIDRDGTSCFYCGLPLEEDITLEHLIPLTAGGKNILSNMVLAHENCNNKMGDLPLNKKVEKAIATRINNIDTIIQIENEKI